MSLTKSIMGAGHTLLDMPLRVLGTSPANASLTGAGAARLMIGPVQPVEYAGAHYIAIDFGAVACRIEARRQGLMKLFNRDIPIDWRYISAFGRDISCLTSFEYAQLNRPRFLSRFPVDLLQNPNLEFAGWFEDGWLSSESYVVLSQPRQGDQLELRGSVPGIGKLLQGQTLTLRINRGSPRQFKLDPGEFVLRIPVEECSTAIRVELSFSGNANLPSPDDRPVAAKIAFLGLTAK